MVRPAWNIAGYLTLTCLLACGAEAAHGTPGQTLEPAVVTESVHPPPAPTTPLELDPSRLAVDIRLRGGMSPPRLPGATEVAASVPPIAVAIRGDGQALFSVAEGGAGPPFRRGHVDVDRLRAWLEARRAAGSFEDENLAYSRVGPDAPCWSIRLRAGPHELSTCSWHYQHESSTTVVTASGITALAGRDRGEVLAAQPEPYRRYVRDFEALIVQARELLPEGEVVPEGEVGEAVLLGRTQ